MRVIFDDFAKLELDDGKEYYEMEVIGLGKRFKQEVKRAINIIKKMPEIGSQESGNIRRYILHKFPYKVLYSIEKDHIYVIAIAHLHREPMYWINRIRT
ncbi:MAG: plasmid stabilization protein [Planctomycetes bacterium RBG_16_41_13]|nr:MAG: plasmid stabilization protein [Planctomycetes bacterium RBG_16_41_13]